MKRRIRMKSLVVLLAILILTAPAFSATDAGTDLGASYNTDYDGIPRPQLTAWDMGAYEYHATELITVSDINSGGLTISNIGSGNLTISNMD